MWIFADWPTQVRQCARAHMEMSLMNLSLQYPVYIIHLIWMSWTVHLYNSTDTATAWKNSCYILSEWSDFHMIDNLPIAVLTYVDITFNKWHCCWGMWHVVAGLCDMLLLGYVTCCCLGMWHVVTGLCDMLLLVYVTCCRWAMWTDLLILQASHLGWR